MPSVEGAGFRSCTWDEVVDAYEEQVRYPPHSYVPIYIYISTYICLYVYIYIYIYIHTHTYIYTYLHKNLTFIRFSPHHVSC